MSVLAWALVSALYLVLLWTAGVATFRRGHYVMFFVGVVLPVVWIAGVIVPPTPEVEAARAQQRLEGQAGRP